MCGSMANIQSAAAEIRRGKKRRTNYSMKIYMVSVFHRATIIIPMHMMTREIIPGRKTEGSTVSSINCDRSSLI